MNLPKDDLPVLPSHMVILTPSAQDISSIVERSRELLAGGKVIAYPTETFYGLGAKYDDESALERVFSIKHRAVEKAMPLIIGSRELLPLVAETIPPAAEELMKLFWPGPLTLLMHAVKRLSAWITAGTGKVAVRVPGSSFALDLARGLEFPITATSANLSGKWPADNAGDVKAVFGSGIDALIDCGKTPGGLPSTIIDVTGGEIRIMRQGAVTEEMIFAGLRHGSRRAGL